MSFFVSNLFIKILVGIAIVGTLVNSFETPQTSASCTTLESYPNRSAVYECPAGLETDFLRNPTGRYVFTTITANIKSEAWLAKIGDKETMRTIRQHLGAPSVIGPGAFMAVSNGEGLVYINCLQKCIISIAWDTSHAPTN